MEIAAIVLIGMVRERLAPTAIVHPIATLVIAARAIVIVNGFLSIQCNCIFLTLYPSSINLDFRMLTLPVISLFFPDFHS